MASSVSEREEQNPSIWLATRAHDGVILPVRDYPLRPATPESSVFFPYNQGKPLTRLVRWRWLDIGIVLTLRVYGRPSLCLFLLPLSLDERFFFIAGNAKGEGRGRGICRSKYPTDLCAAWAIFDLTSRSLKKELVDRTWKAGGNGA